MSPNPTRRSPSGRSSSRRSLLAAGCAAAATGLAGCADLLGPEELAHEVEAYNRRDTAHTLSVRVENADGDALYRRTFEIEGDRAREGTEPFTGTPTTIVVTVDDREPVEREWPDPNCEQQGTRSAGGVDVYLLPDGEVQLEPTCDTIYAE
ncbi:hypothetical protein [Halorubrum lipolyticum]|uniref:Ig-like domain-containing protein n=1 Tax=Halorubrum lipolyticum DSM 21995 TaxID=1227482 RepID=M0P1A0_9EURY|nr:hypothetical protein [Halorubrum lipolyticum]EMA63861.1 hypothetical protein C469_01879 [Halorubrum lipolyticum DSM 21995]